MTESEAIKILGQCLLPQRWERLTAASRSRTRWVTVAFDSLTHSHNINAVMRTCECLGIQDVHVVRRGGSLKKSAGISRGASKWLTVHEYASLNAQLAELRNTGYRLIGTSPTRGDRCIPIAEFSPTIAPVALLFGQEKYGMAEEAQAAVEANVFIPMSGLTESLNVSVAAGMLLESIIAKMDREEFDYRLDREASDHLLLSWLKKSIKSAEVILERNQ